ncbi:hypothetical protein [Klebsiella sp. RHBSTW-00215]|nr:hypothetical protein [Klebsiella sp. RHBSTW-00215]
MLLSTGAALYKTNADGVALQNGLGQSIMFIFDDKGVLKKHGSV